MAITISPQQLHQNPEQMLALARREPVFISADGEIIAVLSSYRHWVDERSPVEVFSSGHPAGDIDDSFDRDLAAIRASSGAPRPWED